MSRIGSNAAPKRVLLAATIAAEECLRTLAPFAWKRGWHLACDMAHTGIFPPGWKGDGIISVMSYQEIPVSDILTADAPCVEITLDGDGIFCPSVRPDHSAIGRLAADHLHERGYRSFAWAPHLCDGMNAELRAGFRARLQALNCDCHELAAAHRLQPGQICRDWASHRRTRLAELGRLPRRTAIFAANDCVAADVLRACRELDLAIPEEIAVLGVGDHVSLCESLPIALSSINVDVATLAFRAAEALDDLMDGRSVPDLMRVSPRGVADRRSAPGAVRIAGASAAG